MYIVYYFLNENNKYSNQILLIHLVQIHIFTYNTSLHLSPGLSSLYTKSF